MTRVAKRLKKKLQSLPLVSREDKLRCLRQWLDDWKGKAQFYSAQLALLESATQTREICEHIGKTNKDLLTAERFVRQIEHEIRMLSCRRAVKEPS